MHGGGFGNFQCQAVGWQAVLLQGAGHAVDQTGMAELDGRQVHRHAPAMMPLVQPLTHLTASLSKYPLTNGDDQAGLFRQADEAVRQQQALLRVLPAQQRFGTDRLAGLGVELGLIMQAELALLQRHAQVLQQLQLLARVAVHRHIEEAVTVLSGALGMVHGSVGITQQLMLVLAVARIQDDAQAGRQLQVVLGHAERPGHQVDLLDRHVHGIVRLLQFHQQHEFVAANPCQRVLAVQVAAQAGRYRFEQKVTDMMAKGIVDWFEAVQINEHQGKTAALLRHFGDGLFDAIGQQGTVGQIGEGVVQGQLGQFLVGQGQRTGQLGSTCLETRVQHRSQQSHCQYCQRGDQHQVNQAVTLQSAPQRAAEAALGEVRRGHAGVMHANDGNAHDHRRQAADLPYIGCVCAQAEGDPQCRRRGTYGNQQRSTEQRRVVIDARQHAQGSHAGVVHASDTGAHDQRAEPQLQRWQARLADQPQGKARGQHSDQQRERGQGQVVPQVDGQAEGKHANEMHRPHADAHGQRTAAHPQAGSAALGRGDAAGQVKGGIGCQDRHAQRNQHQRRGVATGQH